MLHNANAELLGDVRCSHTNRTCNRGSGIFWRCYFWRDLCCMIPIERSYLLSSTSCIPSHVKALRLRKDAEVDRLQTLQKDVRTTVIRNSTTGPPYHRPPSLNLRTRLTTTAAASATANTVGPHLSSNPPCPLILMLLARQWYVKSA